MFPFLIPRFEFGLGKQEVAQKWVQQCVVSQLMRIINVMVTGRDNG